MFKIYWTDNQQPYSFDTESLSIALEKCNSLRSQGFTFVTMVSENPSSVGKPGAAGVEQGRLPDGQKYDWSQKDRANLPKKRHPPISTDNLIVKLDDD